MRNDYTTKICKMKISHSYMHTYILAMHQRPARQPTDDHLFDNNKNDGNSHVISCGKSLCRKSDQNLLS